MTRGAFIRPMQTDNGRCGAIRFSERSNWSFEDNELSRATRELKAEGRVLLDLSVSNPTRCGLDLRGFELARAFRNEGLFDYSPDPWGLKSAREAVSAYFDERGLDAPPSRIMLTPSTSDGYNYLFRLLCNPGDSVLAPVPSYPLFQFLADVNDVTLVPYPLTYADGRWQIDRPALEQAVTDECRALVLVNPNNPTGSYIRQEDLGFLRSFARERGLALICDEVFSEFPLDAASDAVHSLVGEHGVLNFVLGGLSKTLALPQMKLSWIVVQGPESDCAAACPRLEMIADTFLSVSTPIQLAAPQWLAQRAEIQAPLLKRLSDNLTTLQELMAGVDGIEVLRSEGGWYAVLRLSHVMDEHGLVLKLLRREGVLVHPGFYYDFASGAHFVLSLLTPPQAWREGLQRIAAFYQREV